MTVPAESIRDDYVGNGTTDTYDYNFQIYQDSDLKVIQIDTDSVETVLTLDTDYTVSGTGDVGGGSITLTAGNLTSGYLLAITPDFNFTQDTDLRNQGGYFPDTLETALDKLTRIAQQLRDSFKRSIKVTDGEDPDSFDFELPDSATRASKFIVFDADGNISYSNGSGTDTGLRTDLADNSNGLGASLVGIEDAAGNFDATDVEAALAEILSNLASAVAGKGGALITLESGDTVQDLANDASDLVSTLGDVSILASNVNASLVDRDAVLNEPITTNLADPNVTDEPEAADVSPTPLASTADLLWRVRNSGTGATDTQDSASYGSFAVSPKYDVAAATEYTVSMHGAPLGFKIYDTAFDIQEFDTNGEFIGNITATVDSSKREMTFTTTTGVKVAFNIRNDDYFSNDNPMDADSLDLCLNRIMLNTGSSSSSFSPYSDGVFAPTNSLFDSVSDELIKVTKQGNYIYIRTVAQQSDTYDVVWRLTLNQALNRNANTTKTGVVDFYEIHFIASSADDTVEAFNLSSDVHMQGTDESCPVKLNSMFLGGNHGVVGYKATATAHGKQNIDVGSKWSDGTDTWVLYYIDDVDNLTLVRLNTGTTDKWVIGTSDFGSSTLTHVSGATNTANISVSASAQAQVIPIVRNYLGELRIDDTEITADGDYIGGRVVISEVYALLGAGSQQAFLIASAGSGVDADGIAAANSSAGATVTMDGVLTSGGTYSGANNDSLAHTITVLDLGGHNQTTATYTFTGTDINGDALVESLAGPAASSSIETTGYFYTVTSIAISSPVAGSTVDVGPGEAEPYYDSPAIAEQVRFYYEYEWNFLGAMSVRAGHGVKAAYARTLDVDYWGGIQLQRVSLATDTPAGMHDKAFIYIPEVAAVSGLDFEAIAEITSHAAQVVVPKSSCDDSANPASHFCLIGKDSSDVVLSGHVFGMSREDNLGVPATRSANINNIYYLSAANKNYPIVIDQADGDAVAGDNDFVTMFRAPFLPTDSELTIPAVIATMNGRYYCYITAHQNLTNKSVSIPTRFNGFPVTVVKSSANVTVHDSYVTNGTIAITVTSAYGDIVLRLGN